MPEQARPRRWPGVVMVVDMDRVLTLLAGLAGLGAGVGLGLGLLLR